MDVRVDGSGAAERREARVVVRDDVRVDVAEVRGLRGVLALKLDNVIFILKQCCMSIIAISLLASLGCQNLIQCLTVKFK